MEEFRVNKTLKLNLEEQTMKPIHSIQSYAKSSELINPYKNNKNLVSKPINPLDAIDVCTLEVPLSNNSNKLIITVNTKENKPDIYLANCNGNIKKTWNCSA